MKEKFIVTSLLVGAAADASTTFVALQNGIPEGMPGTKHFIENGQAEDALVLKVALTALIIGAYVLSKKIDSDEKKFKLGFVVDKFARSVNLITWGAAAINAIYLAQTLR